MAFGKSARSPLTAVGCGLLMGCADVVPGVSGGTVALVLGIYERLIASIRALVSAALALVRADRQAASGYWRRVEWGFLLPLGVGILAALAVGALVIPPLLERYPAQAAGLFFGLVAASLPLPLRRIARVTGVHLAALAAAAAVAFLLVGLPPAGAAEPSGIRVFASAAVAICAMILPGVSGAFLLEVLGVYRPTLEAARTLDLAYVALFGAGAVVGLASFVKLLGRLLERSHDLTMAVLVGLMLGALRALWPWLAEDRSLQVPPADFGHVAGVVLLAAAGFVAVTALARLVVPAPGRSSVGADGHG